MNFEKIDESRINRENEYVDQEYQRKKPATQTEEEKEHPAKNIVGNVLSITGTVATLVAGIGGAMLVLEFVIGAFGLSALFTIAILFGSGFLINLVGNQMVSNPWIPIGV